MKKGSLALHVCLWFMAIPAVLFLWDALQTDTPISSAHPSDAAIVYGLYFLSATWAAAVFKYRVYSADRSILHNAVRFVAFALALGLGAVVLVVSLFWIVAIKTGTAP